MTEAARRETYNKWSRDEARVVCATVAFGMGVDKPDVRTVVCYGLTKSLEGTKDGKEGGGEGWCVRRLRLAWGWITPDVRTVVCYGLTKSSEGTSHPYYSSVPHEQKQATHLPSLPPFLPPSDFLQMTGRAVRDGLPSRGVLFWALKDLQHSISWPTTRMEVNSLMGGRRSRRQGGNGKIRR